MSGWNCYDIRSAAAYMSKRFFKKWTHLTYNIYTKHDKQNISKLNAVSEESIQKKMRSTSLFGTQILYGNHTKLDFGIPFRARIVYI